MTREEIQAELAERAALPAPQVPAGLTEEEELAWLRNMIEARQREMGLPSQSQNADCPPTARQKSESSAA